MHEATAEEALADARSPTPAVRALSGGNGKKPNENGDDKPETEETEDGDLDEALEETFPASDPLPPPSTPGTD